MYDSLNQGIVESLENIHVLARTGLSWKELSTWQLGSSWHSHYILGMFWMYCIRNTKLESQSHKPVLNILAFVLKVQCRLFIAMLKLFLNGPPSVSLSWVLLFVQIVFNPNGAELAGAFRLGMGLKQMQQLCSWEGEANAQNTICCMYNWTAGSEHTISTQQSYSNKTENQVTRNLIFCSAWSYRTGWNNMSSTLPLLACPLYCAGPWQWAQSMGVWHGPMSPTIAQVHQYISTRVHGYMSSWDHAYSCTFHQCVILMQISQLLELYLSMFATINITLGSPNCESSK